MSVEQLKAALTAPPSEEELLRRQAVIARTLAHRKDLVITPLTTADLVRQARAEDDQADGDNC